MNCHEVLRSTLTSEAAASLLLYLQHPYPCFGGIIMRWDLRIHKEVEYMILQFPQAVSHLPERFLQFLQILVEQTVKALESCPGVGHIAGIFVSPVHRLPQQFLHP